MTTNRSQAMHFRGGQRSWQKIDLFKTQLAEYASATMTTAADWRKEQIEKPLIGMAHKMSHGIASYRQTAYIAMVAIKNDIISSISVA